jgi:TRAP-type C4-dicarboxylate transport system permease small subunit
MRRMSDSPFNEPADSVESLRQLVQETQENDDPGDSNRNLLISGVAMLVVAGVVAFVGWWLLKGGWTVMSETQTLQHRPRHDPSGLGTLMMLAGAAVMFGGVVLVVFALVSFWKVVMRRAGR